MPPLSWNEIKSRAVAFSRRWADEASEQAEAKTFWNEFFHVFGIDCRRVASFEQRVKKLDGRDGCIDLLWKGKLLIEHKSRGKDLDRAHQQDLGYFPGLKESGQTHDFYSPANILPRNTLSHPALSLLLFTLSSVFSCFRRLSAICRRTEKFSAL